MTAPVRPRRGRRLFGWMAAAVLLAVLAEGVARFHLPAIGVTPFCAPRLDGPPADLRPNFETVYSGVPVRTNAEGLRGGPLLPRDPGRMRVAIVGDSFAFGSGVREEHTLAAQLEAALLELGQPAEVLNFGVPGYNATDAVQVAIERALPLEPDAVVYLFFANDVDPPLPRADPDPNGVIEPRRGYFLGSAALQWLFLRAKNLAIELGVDANRSSREYKRQALDEGGRERLLAALDLFAERVATGGRTTCVVLYPFLTPPFANAFEPVDDLLREAAGERGLDLLDLAPLLTHSGRPHGLWANAFDSHPGPEANRRAARALAERLLRPRGDTDAAGLGTGAGAR